MATAKNDITGDSIASKTSTEAYRNNFEAIFRKKRADEESRLAALSNAPADSYTSVTTDNKDDHAGHSTDS